MQRYLIDGPTGRLEIAVEEADLRATQADGVPRGLAFVAHPHPLFQGTMDNKVATTLARTFVQLGYRTARLNFRGVGESEGTHDKGIGEQDDLLALIAHLRAGGKDAAAAHTAATMPIALAGFSFGAFVASAVAKTLAERDPGLVIQRLVVVGMPAGNWDVPSVREDTIVIHGEQDDTIPLTNVFEWARPQELPITVVPGADHFFHRKLHIVKRLVTESWRV
ncbi:alpha/beta hydrolase [Robbsia andropogonis]|uniref:Alpha/beta hydrolase n=1 Tax=Robbsia andropogonis TaxID=28092 RepID=A0A0F5K2N7_9BURK|nr:CocE/NonD family hydrolase [Robbsia andropogonis]KKB64358.1 alpha/beta hydrolase [Robbsia andropogonis]MCP1120640.1 alpha/beta hydrolase [Robbsia andropogonis]MCP1130375.1 alpha/beta hydrolase [Robbsia andropogonis]